MRCDPSECCVLYQKCSVTVNSVAIVFSFFSSTRKRKKGKVTHEAKELYCCLETSLVCWVYRRRNAMTDQTIWTDWGKSSKICTYYSCVVYTKLCMMFHSILPSIFILYVRVLYGFSLFRLLLWFLTSVCCLPFLSQIFPVTHTSAEVEKIVNLENFCWTVRNMAKKALIHLTFLFYLCW